jgi:Tol biopolymer transport system component
VNKILKNARSLRADWQERVALAITAAIGIALSTGVMAALIYLLIALGSLMYSHIAYAQAAPPAAAVRLEAGIEKENVDGDLKAAMTIYEKIASDASAPREVRAKALLRLAGCDEKLGKQAKQLYEQIVRDYSDQPAAVQARRRLAVIKQQEHPAPPPTMTARKIDWVKLGSMGSYDTDGERATFIGTDGNLYFGDVAGHNRHLVFTKNELWFGWWATRDFSKVAIPLRVTESRRMIIAEAKMDGTGYRELIRDDNGAVFGSTVDTLDDGGISWSWDNRYLAVITRPQGEDSRLIVVDASNGSHRELVRSDSDWLSSVRFSPDGRFIAYEATPAKSKVGTDRVYVIPARGGEPHLANEVPKLDSGGSHVLMDWTADGRHLITKEIQQNKSALYLLPIKDGVPSGPSEFVRFGDFDEAHTTLSGALVYQDHAATATDVDAYLASIDSMGHIGSWRSLDLRGYLNGVKYKDPWPSFSPDGSQIAYRAGDPDPKKDDLIVLDLSSGRQRVIYQSSDRELLCQYSDKVPKIFCTSTGRDGESKTDLFSVDDKTGAVQKIASLQGSKAINHYSDDRRTFYFVDLADATINQITRWDLDNQLETIVVPGPQKGKIFDKPSFDGRWLLRTVDEGNFPNGEFIGSVSVKAQSGGDWKMIVSGVKGLFTNDETTHDGNWAFYAAYDSAGKPALFRVPTAGGAPEYVGGLPSASFLGQNLYLNADGTQILATKFNDRKYDLWVLENFEPPVKK